MRTDWSNDARKRRDRMYIIAEILNVAKDGALKTQIMYKANLSFAQLNEYLSLLIEIKLLKATSKNKRTNYKTTPKGVKYLQSYEEIRNLLTKNEERSVNNNNPPIFWVKRTQ